jgi:hypothetical protein
MSQGASVSWEVSLSCRATDQKLSASDSSGRSWVTGIAYRLLVL